MSFLSRLGFTAVGSFELSPIVVTEEKPAGKPELVYKHPKIGITLAEFNARYFFIRPRVFVDHESGYIRTKLHIDDENDIIIDDYDCPDCTDDGGCSHCERDHLDTHECPVTTPGFKIFLNVLHWPVDPPRGFYEGKLHFLGSKWNICKNNKWVDIDLPIDESIDGNFLAELKYGRFF